MRILIILLTLISAQIQIFASDWTIPWVNAQEAIVHTDFLAAEENFNYAIEIMESHDDTDHPYVYLGRAEILIRNQKYDLALEDLNKALHSQKLTGSEKHNAIFMRISTKFQIGEEPNEVDAQYVVEWSQNRVDQTKDKIIIRNLPNASLTK